MGAMADSSAAPRSFADKKHAAGQWRTRTLLVRWRPVRMLASFVSYKRGGVDRLARAAPRHALAVDLGAGQGAYALWYLGAAAEGASVVAVDCSFEALRRVARPRRGKIMRVCADAEALPLRSECGDALYSVDALGHLQDMEKALDEAVRVTRPGARLFLHSECGSPQKRWPDKALIRRLGYDFGARLDGHRSLFTYEELRAFYGRRFHIESIWSPAGCTGWLTGYPEKYRPAFAAAGFRSLAALTAVFAFVKRAPLAGLLLRGLNACINRVERAVGFDGGGSVFAVLRKPVRAGAGAAPGAAA